MSILRDAGRGMGGRLVLWVAWGHQRAAQMPGGAPIFQTYPTTAGGESLEGPMGGWQTGSGWVWPDDCHQQALNCSFPLFTG